MNIASPALVVTVIASAPRLRTSEAARRWLGGLWQDLDTLGLDQPIGGVGTPSFPDSFAEQVQFKVLAARQRPHDPSGGIRQALLVQSFDMVAMTAVLGSAAGHSWKSLADEFASATNEHSLAAPPPAVLGSASICLGLVASPADSTRRPHHGRGTGSRPPRIPQPPAAAAGSRVPVASGHLWDDHWYVTGEGFHLAEARVPGTEHPAGPRVFVLLADGRLEGKLDHWSWSSSRQLPPLIRYLAHAAKVSDQWRVYQDGQHFRELRQRIEQTLDELGNVDIGSADLRWLVATRHTLTRQQSDTAGLITALTRIRAMAVAVGIADTNMGASLPLPAKTVRDRNCAVVRDHEAAAWLSTQLNDDATVLQSTADRAAHVETMIRDHVSQRQRGYAQQVTVIQTSILGAILMALASIQSLGYTVPVSPALRAPLVIFLTVLALVLPGATLRWTRGVGDNAPWPAVDLIGLTLLGAASARLLIAIVDLHHSSRANGFGAVLVTAAGAALCLVAGLRARR